MRGVSAAACVIEQALAWGKRGALRSRAREWQAILTTTYTNLILCL